MDTQIHLGNTSDNETYHPADDASADKGAFDGYPKLAQLMALHPDAAIVRRFGELNMINLLRLQAELQDMEHQLLEIRREDAGSRDGVRETYVKDFRVMRDWKEEGDSLQYDLLLDISDKLKEYNSALSQSLELNRFARPTSRELNFLRTWLIRPSMGNNFLADIESKIWEASNDHDFVTLFPRELEEDAFTKLLHGSLLDIYHRTLGGSRRKEDNSLYPGTNFRAYKEAKLAKISNVITATLSSLLPTSAILVLYLIKPMYARIGLIIGFTALFALVLSLCTSARRVEVFSATAAFAAVEVVFVGSVGSS